MKSMTRLGAFFLVIMMLLSSCVTASALDSPSRLSLEGAKVTIAKKSGAWTGEVQTVAVKVKLKKATLVEGKDYVVTGNTTSGSNAGKYPLEVVVEGIGAYKGVVKKTLQYTIVKATQKLSFGVKKFTVSAAELPATLNAAMVRTGDGVLVIKPSKYAELITISPDGIITLPQGLKPKTYRLKVSLGATTNCKKSKTRVITIKVTR